MRNKDYQTMAVLPGFKPTFAVGLAASCCPSNLNDVSLRTIHAQVIDEFGDALPGVSIWPEGNESAGTTTDLDGNFTLKNIPINTVINFSYVSTITQVIALRIEDKVVINTALQGDEIVIFANKDKTLKYLGYGLLALLVLYGVSRMGKKDKKTVKASI